MSATIKPEYKYASTFLDSLNAELIHHLITPNAGEFRWILYRYLCNYHLELNCLLPTPTDRILKIVQNKLLKLGIKKYIGRDIPITGYFLRKLKSNIIVNHKNYLLIKNETYKLEEGVI